MGVMCRRALCLLFTIATLPLFPFFFFFLLPYNRNGIGLSDWDFVPSIRIQANGTHQTMQVRPISALSHDFSTRLALPINASRKASAAAASTTSASSRKLSWPEKISESSTNDSHVQLVVKVQIDTKDEKTEKRVMGIGRKRDSGLGKIELGLAKARAAIRRAVLSRNYTSSKVQSFVPRGSIYRNPYAFHQLSRTKLHSISLPLFCVWSFLCFCCLRRFSSKQTARVT